MNTRIIFSLLILTGIISTTFAQKGNLGGGSGSDNNAPGGNQDCSTINALEGQHIYSICDFDDDAEEIRVCAKGAKGIVILNDLELDVLAESENETQIVGLRFTDIKICEGTTITSAYIQFTAAKDGNPNGSDDFFKIYAEIQNPFLPLDSYANEFKDENENLSSRNRTLNGINMDKFAWSKDTKINTPDLSGLIQTMMNQEGYEGNLVFLIDQGACQFENAAYSADADPDGDHEIRPKLIINFDANCEVQGELENLSDNVEADLKSLNVWDWGSIDITDDGDFLGNGMDRSVDVENNLNNGVWQQGEELQFLLTPELVCSPDYRAEARRRELLCTGASTDPDECSEGMEQWMGLSYRFGDDYMLDDMSKIIIFQVRPGFDYPNEDDNGPSSYLFLEIFGDDDNDDNFPLSIPCMVDENVNCENCSDCEPCDMCTDCIDCELFEIVDLPTDCDNIEFCPTIKPEESEEHGQIRIGREIPSEDGSQIYPDNIANNIDSEIKNKEYYFTGITPEPGMTIDVVIHIIYNKRVQDENETTECDGLFEVWLTPSNGPESYIRFDGPILNPEYPYVGNRKFGLYHHEWPKSPCDVHQSINEGVEEIELFVGTYRELTRYPDHPNFKKNAFHLVNPARVCAPEGECLIPGTPCNDGYSITTNDVIIIDSNGDCICQGKLFSDLVDVEISISEGNGDVVETNGQLTIDNLSLTFETNYMGLQFIQEENQIPPNSYIKSAYVQFAQTVGDGQDGTNICIDIFGESSPTPYSENAPLVSERIESTSISSNKHWRPHNWEDGGSSERTNLDHRTADITNIVQEIIDSEDYANGNNTLGFLFQSQGDEDGLREAESFENGTAPELVIEYLISSEVPPGTPKDEDCFPESPESNEFAEKMKNPQGNDNLLNSEINVTPNPFGNYFDIQLESTADEVGMIKIYNINGHLQENLEFQKKNIHRINSESWYSGLYIIVVTIGKNRYSKRIVKR